MFATYELPTTLVSDNGPPFTSAEFEKFMKANGITHRRIPPYHPSSNRLADNMVRTVKQALSKCKISANATLETHIARFLASYRNTRHTTTSKTPAELLLCRTPHYSSLCITTSGFELVHSFACSYNNKSGTKTKV